MKKSPIDNLFFELYGNYPPKAGQAYEMIVAAAFKLLLNKDIDYNQRLFGDFSNTSYQLDGLISDSDSKEMIEAKDYTINDKKVGRGDIQKLQGALSDLPVDKGVFASATDYTKPAKKYSDSSKDNPLNKPVDLYHIRPSTVQDEEGRIKKITINMSMHHASYDNSTMQLIWTKEGASEIMKDGLGSTHVSMTVDKFYDKEGNILITIHDLTKNHPAGTTFEEGFVSKGCWIIKNGYLKYNDKLYSIAGVEYEVPYLISRHEIIIENEGTPRLYIKAVDGTIDKLITDKDLKKVRFNDGKVDI